LGCFGGGAYISNNFLGLNIRFRAKTRDLENGFLEFGIQKWDFLLVSPLGGPHSIRGAGKPMAHEERGT
jgi:hypothetical protein